MAKKIKIISKKHLARLERERRQSTIITSATIGVVLAVILLIGYGYLNQTVFQAKQPVAMVGEESISTRDFQTRVRVTRQQLINQYLQYLQFAQYFGVDPYTDETFSQQLAIIEGQLNDPTSIGNQVLDQMVDEILIRREAERLGITASEQEIEQEIQAAFRYFPDGTPTPTITPTLLAYSTLSATQMALVTLTPTPSPFPTGTASPSPTLNPDATPTTISPVAPTTIPSVTPTATEYTLAEYQSKYQSALQNFEELGISEEDYRSQFRNQILREKVLEALTADIPAEQEQVWARHILVSDEATATLVRDQLMEGGDWTTLAAQYSLDTATKDSGGDLGWFEQGKMVLEFESVAFSLHLGTISHPIQTTVGWHILQVLGHEKRPLSASQYRTLREEKFQALVLQLRDNVEVIIFDYWVDRVPSEPTLENALNEIFSQATP